VDLSPCFTADGGWEPGAGCDAFPLDPLAAAGWADGCATQPVSGPVTTCGRAFGEGEGGTDTGADETTDGGVVDGSTGTDDAASTTTGGSTSGGPPPEPDTTSGDETGGGAARSDAHTDGCGCRSYGGRSAGLFVLAAAAVRRRRLCATAPVQTRRRLLIGRG
jgi:hypothetical protein